MDMEEEMGMAPDMYREVFDLAQRGTRAFRDRLFDEVIAELSLFPELFFVFACSRVASVSVYPGRKFVYTS